MLPHFYAHVNRFWVFETHLSCDSRHIWACGAGPLVYLQKEKKLVRFPHQLWNPIFSPAFTLICLRFLIQSMS
jgi:hypothetical protein